MELWMKHSSEFHACCLMGLRGRFGMLGRYEWGYTRQILDGEAKEGGVNACGAPVGSFSRNLRQKIIFNISTLIVIGVSIVVAWCGCCYCPQPLGTVILLLVCYNPHAIDYR
uniref:Uncharacterized protein n=1 Tax=Nelumbo nucifera TaxID=4432 RepID=A0A822YMB3_NELNU|nr:TPA_asm: hypothetical protein HUJ06_012478 [Nelumbo nucifera]